MTKWIEVPGIVKPGHQIASGKASDSPYPKGSVEMQTPFFKQRGLDLSPFYSATLNISLKPFTFAMQNPEYVFRSVHWIAGFPPEDFSFSRCSISYEGNWHEGLVYYPHPETKSQHFQDASTIEIITHYIQKITYGDAVQLKLNGDEITLTQ